MLDVGKGLVILGLVIAVLGLLIWSGFGRGWFGQLPGDLNVNRGNRLPLSHSKIGNSDYVIGIVHTLFALFPPSSTLLHALFR